MNNSTVNFTTPEETTNDTIGFLVGLEICCYIINVLFGLPAHAYIIWLIIKTNGFASEFLILNLTICETGQCVNCMSAILKIWFPSFKTLSLALFGLFFTGRPVFQCLICVERYLAVVHPVTFLKYKPLRYKVICCTAAWMICLGSCLCCLLLKSYGYGVAYRGLFSTQFFIFLSIQMFCCVAVLKALKQSGPGQRGREKEEEHHIKRKAFYLILITTVSILITYPPFVSFGFSVVMSTDLVKAVWLIGLICFVLCGFVQPVLYLNRAGKLSCFGFP